MNALTLDQSLADRIVELVAEGNSVPEAFSMCGVPDSTRTRWLRRARGMEGSPDPLLTRMWQQLEQAKIDGRERRIAAEKHRRTLELEALKERIMRTDLAMLPVTHAQTPVLTPTRSTIRVVSRRRRRRW